MHVLNIVFDSSWGFDIAAACNSAWITFSYSVHPLYCCTCRSVIQLLKKATYSIRKVWMWSHANERLSTTHQHRSRRRRNWTLQLILAHSKQFHSSNWTVWWWNMWSPAWVHWFKALLALDLHNMTDPTVKEAVLAAISHPLYKLKWIPPDRRDEFNQYFVDSVVRYIRDHYFCLHWLVTSTVAM